MIGEKRIVLDPRLSMIASLVGRCESYADIGCDHGRLGAYMLQNHLCERAQLTDISEPSLAKAKRLIALLGLTDRVSFRVGDGAMALEEPADCVVIAGMGGTTIADIIRQGREKLGDARLVLQPNVGAPELRAAVSENGCVIVDERIVPDGRRNYVIIVTESGKSDYGLEELYIGPVLMKRMPPELGPYADFRLRVAKKALLGASKSNDESAMGELRREIEIWEEARACLRRLNRY